MGAVISECGNYRYRLDRPCQRNESWTTAIIMVNPSTADATENDATIRKVLGFAREKAWGSIVVGNLFAYRTKDVRELGQVDDPIGPENDRYLTHIFAECDQAIMAWGPLAKQPRHHRNRYLNVMNLARISAIPTFCIAPTVSGGQPRHPLMPPYSSAIEKWTPPQ